uniref:PDZ and LIM domain-containing protein n=1 Tax=Junco hyemalis TaxID=40217 RepID=A0A8C5IK95_JUNHY
GDSWGGAIPMREDSEVYKMLQENRELRAAPRQSSTFRLLQEAPLSRSRCSYRRSPPSVPACTEMALLLSGIRCYLRFAVISGLGETCPFPCPFPCPSAAGTARTVPPLLPGSVWGGPRSPVHPGLGHGALTIEFPINQSSHHRIPN